MTIIFKPRISNNADLEVGNLIRIHSPWYESFKLYHYNNLQGLSISRVDFSALSSSIHATSFLMLWCRFEQEGGAGERRSNLLMLVLLPGPVMTLSSPQFTTNVTHPQL